MAIQGLTMLLTDTQGLPYPEQDDFVSALQLQALAEAVDTKIAASLAGFNAVLNKFVRVVRLSANQTGFVTGGASQQINFDQYTYNTDPLVAASAIRFNVAGTGIYMGGLYVPTQAPAPTLNTARTASFWVEDRPGPEFTTVVREFWQTEVYETNTGGEDQIVIATFPVYSPGEAFCFGALAHTNGTVVTVLAGAYMWVQRIGDLEV